MDDRVKRWAISHRKEVGRAESATPHEHIEKKLDEYMQTSLPAEIETIRKILGL
jgi:hypothetical protein